MSFSSCLLSPFVWFWLQGLEKRKIAVCIYKQTIKIKSTMYWHRRICSVIHMFLGSARLLLCTANGILSPALTSVLITALFICASFFLCPLWVRSCKTQLSSAGGRLAQLSWILGKLVPDVLFWHSVMGWLLNTSLWPSAVVLCSVVASPLTS